MYRRVARLGFAQIHRVLDSPNYYGVFLHYNGVDSLQRRRGMLALRFMSRFLGKKILTAKPVQFEGVMPLLYHSPPASSVPLFLVSHPCMNYMRTKVRKGR